MTRRKDTGVWASTRLTDTLYEFLTMELVEDRDHLPDGRSRWSAPGPDPLPLARRTVEVVAVDLSERGWMRCEYTLVVDCSTLAPTIPTELRDHWLLPDPTTGNRTRALLHRTTPFDVTDTEPTTAGIVDPGAADDIADLHVLAPLEAALGPDRVPTSVAALAHHALTPTDGYRLDARIWRTCCLLLAASGHTPTARQIIDHVRTRTVDATESPERITSFAAWLENLSDPGPLRWTPTDQTPPTTWPTPEPRGTVIPARARWRSGDTKPEHQPDLTPEPLIDSYAGRDLQTWLGGMSILDLEFDTIDIRGAYGGMFRPENLDIVERHLLDTFPSWGHATLQGNRDLLDRYQRHLGELVRNRVPGTWIERFTPDHVLDPVVRLDSGQVFDPTAHITHALTTRSGRTYRDLLDKLDSPHSARITSGDDAIRAVVDLITTGGIDYPTTGLTATPFPGGWAVFAPFTPDPTDPLSFLDTPVGQAVFYIGRTGRIEKYSSSLSPTECAEQFARSEHLDLRGRTLPES